MGHRFLETLTTEAVKAVQAENGSRNAYARLEGGEPANHRLGGPEAAFLMARDSVYLTSVSASGWPYVQHRGGPPGFLKVLDADTIGFADYRGNRQYISLGNIRDDDRVALFAMDYPNRRRLKILGRMSAVDLTHETEFANVVVDADYGAKVERGFRIKVHALDWNCPQHITPRFTEAEIEEALAPVRERMAELEAENARLRARLAGGADAAP
jgi:hypothetical protein